MKIGIIGNSKTGKDLFAQTITGKFATKSIDTPILIDLEMPLNHIEERIIKTEEIKDNSTVADALSLLSPKMLDIGNVSNNQKKRCAKGLHNYQENYIKEGSVSTIIYQCKCGAFQPHYRK